LPGTQRIKRISISEDRARQEFEVSNPALCPAEDCIQSLFMLVCGNKYPIFDALRRKCFRGKGRVDKIKMIKDSVFSIKRLLAHGKSGTFSLAKILILSVAGAGGNLCYAYGFSWLLSQGKIPVSLAFLFPIALIAFVKLLYLAMEYFMERLMIRMRTQLTKQYQDTLAWQYTHAQYNWIEQQEAGELLGRIESNAKSAALAVSDYLPKAIRSSCTLLFTLVMLLLIEPRIFLVTLICLPILLLLEIGAGHYSSKLFDALRVKKYNH
jgi:ABC-type multidrug transport system fused ATPase/permease subunit